MEQSFSVLFSFDLSILTFRLFLSRGLRRFFGVVKEFLEAVIVILFFFADSISFDNEELYFVLFLLKFFRDFLNKITLYLLNCQVFIFLNCSFFLIKEIKNSLKFSLDNSFFLRNSALVGSLLT